jgi:hypothetical protein
MADNYHQLLVWFRHIISHWYDSDISSVFGMIKTYYQSLVWLRHIISHWYDSHILYTNDWKYVWIIPMTDNMSESCQSLIICLYHTNDWWYVWIIPMTDNISESYQRLIVCLNHTNDSRHFINHWNDSGISSFIVMIQTYYQ